MSEHPTVPGRSDPRDPQVRKRRWSQAAIVTGDVGVVVHVGMFGCHAWIADLATGLTWAEEAMSPTPRVRVRQIEDAWEVLVNVPGLSIEAKLDTRMAPHPLMIKDGEEVLLERAVGLDVTGRARVRSEVRELSGTASIVEVVNAGFPDGMRWSNAAMLGMRAAYLSDLDPIENILWPSLTAEPRALGEATLKLADPTRPGRGGWTIAAGERVQLEFTPRAVRHAGAHTWVFGRFDGMCDGLSVKGAPGICEARQL